MQTRPVLAYRTALHRFSCRMPGKDIVLTHINYIIFHSVLQGALFLYPKFRICRCDIATIGENRRKPIVGIKTPKESRSLGVLSLPVMDNYYLLAYRHYSICENSLQDTPENKISYFFIS